MKHISALDAAKISELEVISKQDYESKLAAIGYYLDRTMDAKSTHTGLTDFIKNHSWKGLSLYPRQADNKVGAFNIEARRDDNYRAMTDIRNNYAFITGDGYLACI